MTKYVIPVLPFCTHYFILYVVTLEDGLCVVIVTLICNTLSHKGKHCYQLTQYLRYGHRSLQLVILI